MKAANFQQTATEAQIQQAIVEALLWVKAEVEVTSERRHRCTNCGEYSHAGTNITKGIGDLLVRNPAWKVGLKLNLEVKSKTGSLTKEQKISVDRGAIIIVRSVDDAIEAYLSFEDKARV